MKGTKPDKRVLVRWEGPNTTSKTDLDAAVDGLNEAKG